jgi:hypothetical protein
MEVKSPPFPLSGFSPANPNRQKLGWKLLLVAGVKCQICWGEKCRVWKHFFLPHDRFL